MKNVILGLVLMFTFIGFANGGECVSGRCFQPRKVVTVTKSITRETVKFPRRLVSGCTNGVCRSRSVTVVR